MLKLTMVERKILINQIEIKRDLLISLKNNLIEKISLKEYSKILEKEEDEIEIKNIDNMLNKLENDIEILKYGYEGLYNNIFDGIFDRTVEDSVTDEIFHFLNMYNILQVNYEKLSDKDKEKVNVNNLLFKGFDAHNEWGYYSQCKFIINDYIEADYSSLMIEDKSLNSHRRMLGKYQRQYDKFLKISDCNNMNVDQILSIIE